MNEIGKIQVVAVVARLFALALFVYVLRQTPDLVVYYSMDLGSEAIVGFYGTRAFALLVIMIVCMAISLLLWFFPLTISRKILPKMVNEEAKGWDNDTQLSVAFIVLGVYLLYYAAVDVAYWGMMFVLSIRHHDLVGSLDVEDWVNVILTCVELLLATLLILRSRGIAHLILKFRGRVGSRSSD